MGEPREFWIKYMEAAKHFPGTTIQQHWENGFRKGAEIEKAKAEKLAEALEFYAKSDYEGEVDRNGFIDPSEWTHTQPDVLEDGGERAIKALADYRGESDG